MRHALPFALLLACGPKDADPADDSTSAASTTEESTTSPTDPTDPTPTTGDECDTDCPDPLYGYVCIRLTRGEGVDADPFVGTTRIQATFAYDPCLIDFYDANPEERLDGPLGASLFDAWQDRLCGEPVGDRVACSVESFQQTLDSVSMPPTYDLQVDYTITDDDLTDKLLLWGPLPLPAHAACAGDDLPSVRLTGLTDITGFSGDDPLWKMQSFGVSPRAVPALDTSGCLVIPFVN